ncbi:MAG: hypothetical protein PUB89_10175 [Oscillospiraceae bacterium]|nr:hypothetical protein [Oscillospiraceae bacterium]
MDISKLYEIAAEKLDKASEVCGKNKINLSSLTVITTAKDNIFSGINWKTLNDSFEEELTCSEDEAIKKMILSGETEAESIITLDASSKLPVNPCQKSLEVLLTINPANTACNILTGKNSKVILTSLNSDIAKFAEQLTGNSKNTASDSSKAESADSVNDTPSIPEGSAAHTGIDASGLRMIFDDWESTADASSSDSKPFSANSLDSTQQEIINTVQNMSQNTGNPAQQYQQPGNMYGGQPMNMYGQQPMNMYGQQPVNNMYGGQPMNNMYNGQPMNNMYGGGQPVKNGMYGQQGGRTSIYTNNPAPNAPQQTSIYTNNPTPNAPQQTSIYTNNKPASANSSTYMNNLQAPVSHSVANTQSVSVYGTNISDGDNNAIFKDRLNNILNSGSKTKNDENDMKDVMMSAKEKKNAAKKDAKFQKK